MVVDMDAELIKSHIHDHRALLEGMGIDGNFLRNKHTSCPVCGGRDRFRFDDKGYGAWYCNQCGSGDSFKLLMNFFGWTFPETLKQVANYLGIQAERYKRPSTPSKAKKPYNPDKGPREWARNQLRQLFKNCVPAEPSQAVPLFRYLSNRGLDLKGLPDSIKFHPNVEYFEPDEKTGKPILLGLYPAMIGVFTDVTGLPVTLHRTYLTESGQKAPVPSPKKVMTPVTKGGVNGCSIKLGMPSDTLYLAEGLETSLAIMKALNVPIWACGSSVFLEKVQVPQWVSKVYIMGDLDASGAGETSANILADRLRSNGIKTAICLPEAELKPGQKSIDWLDVIQGSDK